MKTSADAEPAGADLRVGADVLGRAGREGGGNGRGEPILGLTRAALAERITGELGQPAYRADQVLAWVYGRRVESFAAMTDLPAAFREALAERFVLAGPVLVRQLGAADTTCKLLFRLADGQLVESVLIPASPALYGERSDRRTLCVSSQVGCAYGCRFCASGLDGWTRNLRPDEIVAQVRGAEALSGERVDNLVFMGMGEPLANLDHLLTALEIINAPWGLGIGARHLTVSTSGLVPQIRRLADHPRPVRLAVSLHGATDAVRAQIMPVNRKYPLASLLEACRYWVERKKPRLTFEYILIADLNDDPDQARALARIARGLEARVNLIPYNAVEGLTWRRPEPARQQEFLRELRRAGVAATLRREKGHDIDAACGQLRRQTLARSGEEPTAAAPLAAAPADQRP